MEKEWSEAESSILQFKRELEELADLIPKTNRIHQKISAINKAWRKVQNSLNAMDKFISPVKSIEVNSALLTDSAFRECWTLWKEYLNEQHGITLRSRAEVTSLKRMLEISEDNPKLAISYLEYAMSRLEKYFYKVIDKDNNPKHRNSNTPTVYTIPERYNISHSDPHAGLTN